MAEATHLVTARNINQFTASYSFQARHKHPKVQPQSVKTRAPSRKQDLSLIRRKGSRNPRRLISISTAHGGWQGSWSCDFLLSLSELRLRDLVEDERQDAQVSVNLCIQKHASFGLSVDGRIITSFTRKCSICSSPYCREIDTNFTVWILPSSRDNAASDQLPEIGSDDPSVIYVRPGYEANLDSLVQDTIRLTTFAKDTCSEACEKSEPTMQYVGKQNAASIDKRWWKLLELRNRNL